MTVVLDTNILAALVHARDPHRERAARFMTRVLRGEHGQPVTSDYVLDEGLTLLRARPGLPEASRDYASYFVGDDEGAPPLRMVPTSLDDVRDALDLHLTHYDQELSFTDCILAVLAKRLEAPVASFDDDFDGVVERVEP